MRERTKKVYETKRPTDYVVREGAAEYGTFLSIGFTRTCNCPKTHINCMTAKDWLKSQLGVWQFFYESRDIRNKNLHPATFPISLCKKVIELFTHQGELVLDPFVGSGTTLEWASRMIDWACSDIEIDIWCQALKVDSIFSISLDNFLSETISSFNLADALLTALP